MFKGNLRYFEPASPRCRTPTRREPRSYEELARLASDKAGGKYLELPEHNLFCFFKII